MVINEVTKSYRGRQLTYDGPSEVSLGFYLIVMGLDMIYPLDYKFIMLDLNGKH